MDKSLRSLSKFLSYVLRDHPESIGLSVDENGWASVDKLIHKAKEEGKKLNYNRLHDIISHGSKQRFILSEDGNYIRAGYGHSIDVDLQLRAQQPPEILYHGTAQRNADNILAEGLHSANRNLVHLSVHKADAHQVGARHGESVILRVNSIKMARKNYDFYQSESEPSIWLTKYVPAKFIDGFQ
ncbi:putative RNA 2'-phosphotransferase [Fodinibius salinus]|uniref:Probable RNA 2'-phosphotransferase n=1 Tax=Fodinibius salinus TaxID=860790 RepID=A0A5D3YII0_9BACT|nr:RNA 2'-phosphotransferase [Fodinibius salinus]TYP93654.1 putative RNA 2'-phosphotransferase [Fodinibius salinus]